MDDIAVLIPCFNESKTIEKVISDFRSVLPSAVIYVYDNNSTDSTGKIAQQAGAVVRNETVHGKSAVVRRMFREIDAECYILVDGDDTYDAEDAPKMIETMYSKNCDMVIGDRLSTSYFHENTRPLHNIGNRLVRSCINHIFHAEYFDILSGYRVFSYDFVKTFSVLSNGFQIETEMCIHAADKRMLTDSVPVGYKERSRDNPSKLNTIKDGIKILWFIVRMFYQYKPAMLFGSISMLLVIIATILFIPVWNAYLDTGEVLRFPTLTVCCFMVTTAIQSLLSGLSAQARVWHDRENFEHELLRIHEMARKEENQKDKK